MRVDEKAEKQHYVPKVLLRNFCNLPKDQICAFDKWNGKSFKTNISNVASERNYNVYKDGDETLNAEPFYTSLESEVSQAFEKLNTHRRLSILSAVDIEALTHFVAAQYLRSKNLREAHLMLNLDFIERIKSMGHKPKDVSGFQELNEESVKRLSFEMLQILPDLVGQIHNKELLLLETNIDNPFFVSDNPVVLHNERQFGAYGNIGFALPGIQIYMPLSSTLALAMWCPTITEKGFESYQSLCMTLEKSSEAALHNANEFLKTEAAKTRDEAIHLLESDPPMRFYKLFSEGRPIFQSEENVAFLNGLQVIFAHRFLYSSIDNFVLAKEMVEKDPKYKTGFMPQMN